MKRILAAAVAALVSISALADEGMWMLPTLQKMNAKAMAKLGCSLTPEQIFSLKKSSLKDAIVQFGGGCTGEIISDNGLLVTNHHCGYSNIQKLSTPEHNYLEDGYWAMNMSEEIPAPGLSVTFLQDMVDVTAALKGLSSKEVEAEGDRLEKEAEKNHPGCVATVMGFYSQNQYYLITYKIYKDVRFVGAPPASLGKFGGDTDNWMWPRHTCDFSMFRVYANAENEPAEYSADNVPYTPKKSLKISLKGVKDGDFSMIMGYPGRTQRYQTASQLKLMLANNDVRIDARTVRQDVMWAARMADPVVNLQYASKYAGSSNGWKKWQGERLAFQKLGILERELQKEADLEEWIAADPDRTAKYAGAIDTLDKYSALVEHPYTQLTLLSETLGSIELFGLCSSRDPKAAYKDYNVKVDQDIAHAVLAHYFKNVDPQYKVDLTQEELDAAFENSVFTSEEKYLAATDEQKKADPALKCLMKVIKMARSLNAEVRPLLSAGNEATTKFAGALLEWKAGEPMYPDANFTMRLTYGTVKSYSPKDGVLYKHYTTLKGVMEKENPDDYEFRVPAKVSELYKAADYGQYANKDGELTTCFLTNNDITGGNSGSPVLNAKGELIGLAFDGNWESMSSDVMFEPDLQRCICVDIRYVLWELDKVGGAGWLLDEMKFAKK